jgi:hypothetical protein
LLYVLHTTRTGAELGRYESPELTSEDVEEFLREFGQFFCEDSRHDLWVRSHDDDGTIVLDRHNLIYAYGPVELFEEALRSLGAHVGEPADLGTHVHHYHAVGMIWTTYPEALRLAGFATPTIGRAVRS